jgi:hypothetical protein
MPHLGTTPHGSSDGIRRLRHFVLDTPGRRCADIRWPAVDSAIVELPDDLIARFQRAVTELDAAFTGERLADDNVVSQLRDWLDGPGDPLPWTHPARVTEDEWFFITTLYGEMTLDGQRTHVRRFYSPLFVEAAGRDVRSFVPGMREFRGLRSRWMSGRLCRKATSCRAR